MLFTGHYWWKEGPGVWELFAESHAVCGSVQSAFGTTGDTCAAFANGLCQDSTGHKRANSCLNNTAHLGRAIFKTMHRQLHGTSPVLLVPYLDSDFF